MINILKKQVAVTTTLMIAWNHLIIWIEESLNQNLISSLVILRQVYVHELTPIAVNARKNLVLLLMNKKISSLTLRGYLEETFKWANP